DQLQHVALSRSERLLDFIGRRSRIAAAARTRDAFAGGRGQTCGDGADDNEEGPRGIESSSARSMRGAPVEDDDVRREPGIALERGDLPVDLDAGPREPFAHL